jgi:hypothetical protein
VGYVEVEDLVAVPEGAFEFVDIQGGMTPIVPKQAKFRAGDALNFSREGSEFAFEADRSAVDHKSSSISSIPLYFFGSMGSFSCFLISCWSFVVGLRVGTVAANNTGSNGTWEALAFDPLIFIAL